jgi:hypothetical protein
MINKFSFFSEEYIWFKILITVLSLYTFFTFGKNYYVINNTSKIDFELIEITKKWSRHSYISNARLKIDNKVYNFEVHAQFYDIYKKTGKIEFNLYYDFIFNKYITTADFYFARNLSFLLIFFYFCFLLQFIASCARSPR